MNSSVNSSTIIKKILPVLLVILIIIGVAVSCKVFGNSKLKSLLSEDGEYIRVSDGKFDYVLTRQEAYDFLKDSYGNTVLTDMIDKDLLKAEKNSDGKSFWDAAADGVEKLKEEKIFPNGRPDDEEEATEAIEKYEEDLYLKGYRTEASQKEYHQLIVAKKLFAIAKLEEDIKTKDNKAEKDTEKYFPETTIKSKYEDKYKDGYWAILVTFETEKQATNALAQLGIEIQQKLSDTEFSKEYDAKYNDLNFTRWVWSDRNEPLVENATKSPKLMLTVREVVEALVSLYNTQNSHKLPAYPTDTITLSATKGQYEISDNGEIVFKTDLVKNAEGEIDKDSLLNKLYYTNDELSVVDKQILQSIKLNYSSYNAMEYTKKAEGKETEPAKMISTQRWFTPTVTSLNEGKLHYFAIKIKVDEKLSLDDKEVDGTTVKGVRNEVLKVLKEEKITDNYIKEKMFELRKEKSIGIYDSALEDNYKSNLSSFQADNEITYKAPKLTKDEKKAKNVIAKVGSKVYTTDEFFDVLNFHYAITIIYDRANFASLLSNSRVYLEKAFVEEGTLLNKVYNFAGSDLTEKQRTLDAKRWQEYSVSVVNEKNQFAQSQYFAAGWTWEDYMKYVYKANNEYELKLALLYKDVQADFAARLKDVSKLDESSELWQNILKNMEMVRDEYYNVKGFHLLISVNDESGSPIDPKDWTEYQVECAKELENQVRLYLKAVGDYKVNLQKIQDEFKKAPRFDANKEQNVESQKTIAGSSYVFGDGAEKIEISKFKTAGLSVKYEDLGNFQNARVVDGLRVNTMVEPFAKAVKEIYDDRMSKFTYSAEQKSDKETVIYDKNIQTEFGFHVYVNEESIAQNHWESKKTVDGKEVTEYTVLPTFEQVKKYLKDNKDSSLKSDMLTAIRTYFEPIATEFGGGVRTAMTFLDAQVSIKLTFDPILSKQINLETYQEFIKKQKDLYLDQISYRKSTEPVKE